MVRYDINVGVISYIINHHTKLIVFDSPFSKSCIFFRTKLLKLQYLFVWFVGEFFCPSEFIIPNKKLLLRLCIEGSLN
jgi:hypothetical protein